MLKTKLTLARFGKNGQLIEQREQEARSWLKHFIDLFYCHLSGATLAFNDISGAPRTVIAYAGVGRWNGSLIAGSPPGRVLATIPANTAATSNFTSLIAGENLGIVVGTSNVPVTPTQDALQAKIVHGEGAGQLLHGGTEISELAFADPNGQFTIRRYFTNILGGGITVQEVGIYSSGTTAASTGYAFCVARDVVAPGITVNNGEILEVAYIPQITV